MDGSMRRVGQCVIRSHTIKHNCAAEFVFVRQERNGMDQYFSCSSRIMKKCFLQSGDSMDKIIAVDNNMLHDQSNATSSIS